jgi:hypothetical protein
MIKHLVRYEITGGIQNPQWNTKPPVGYKTPDGIQDHRWDTKPPVGYKNPGGIWGSSKKNLIVYKNPAGSGVPLKNRCCTKTPVG